MTAKRALIVDDSKSARTFLSRILEKFAIDVETAESAELAIEHLATHRPDVIFMDHLMPGMDGFQAVQLIKNNPRTATIPIMMYTSQEGELYLGQARALGAVGVLPKQIRPADVSKVLYQLKLVPDRRTDEQESFEAVDGPDAAFDDHDGTPGAVALPDGDGTVPDAAGVAAIHSTGERPAIVRQPLRETVEAAVHAQLVELRQFLTMSLDDHAARTANDLRHLLQELPKPPPAIPAPRPAAWPWLLATLGALAALAFGALWYRENGARLAAEERLAASNAAAAAAAATAALQVPDLATPTADPGAESTGEPPGDAPPDLAATPVARPGPAPASAASTPPGRGATPPAAPATPHAVTEPVPYGELPLAGARIDALRAALTRAVAQGFRGVVEIRTFAARFCLSGNANEGYSVAPEDTPMAKCDLLGNPHDEALNAGQRESLDFANFAGAFRQSSGNAVEVRVATGDSGSLVMPYPPATDRTTAGEWNRAAAANNRIEVLFHPEG